MTLTMTCGPNIFSLGTYIHQDVDDIRDKNIRNLI